MAKFEVPASKPEEQLPEPKGFWVGLIDASMHLTKTNYSAWKEEREATTRGNAHLLAARLVNEPDVYG